MTTQDRSGLGGLWTKKLGGGSFKLHMALARETSSKGKGSNRAHDASFCWNVTVTIHFMRSISDLHGEIDRDLFALRPPSSFVHCSPLVLTYHPPLSSLQSRLSLKRLSCRALYSQFSSRQTNYLPKSPSGSAIWYVLLLSYLLSTCCRVWLGAWWQHRS